MTADEMKALVKHSDFYDRYDKSKNWDFVAVIAGRAMQSPKINEIQHIFDEKIKSLGNALYADGTIIEGCAISFEPEQKRANLTEGRIFLDGLVYQVKAATLAIPDITTVQISIWKKSKSFTEFEDNTLFDPAKGTPQYHIPGGYRIVTAPESNITSKQIYSISEGEAHINGIDTESA